MANASQEGAVIVLTINWGNENHFSNSFTVRFIYKFLTKESLQIQSQLKYVDTPWQKSNTFLSNTGQ